MLGETASTCGSSETLPAQMRCILPHFHNTCRHAAHGHRPCGFPRASRGRRPCGSQSGNRSAGRPAAPQLRRSPSPCGRALVPPVPRLAADPADVGRQRSVCGACGHRRSISSAWSSAPRFAFCGIGTSQQVGRWRDRRRTCVTLRLCMRSHSSLFVSICAAPRRGPFERDAPPRRRPPWAPQSSPPP